MSNPRTVIEVSMTKVLAESGNVIELMNSLRAYAESQRHNAALIRDLAGTESGSFEMERQTLHRAMSSQVYFADGILTFLQRIEAIAAGAAQPPSPPSH